MRRHIISYIYLPIIGVIMLILMVVIEFVLKPDYIALNYRHRLPPTIVNLSPGRGAVYINDTLIANSSIPLVENKSNIDARDGIKPDYSPLSKEERAKILPRLGALAPPYLIYKKENNDTIVVVKNERDTLKYVLTYEEEEGHWLDTLTFKDLFDHMFKQKNDEKE